MLSILQNHSFTQERERLKSDRIFLVHALDEFGRKAWYYLLTYHGRRDDFKKARYKFSTVRLAEYGKVLYSGYGTNPPIPVKQKMETIYGFRE